VTGPIVEDRPATATDYTLSELMACVLAREIKDGDIGGIPGVRSEVPLAAVCLAARHHAPSMTLYTIHGEADMARLSITGTTSDWEGGLDIAHAYELNNIFELLHVGAFNWIFYGALQIDRFGNINLAGVGDHAAPRLRGPGTAGGNSENFAKRFFVWINEHSPRVFVPAVDFITSAGYGPHDREALGITGAGASPIVTPLAVLDIDRQRRAMRLLSVHPGVTVAEVEAQTGFELLMADGGVTQTQPPTESELDILRTQVDPRGVLRRESPYG
jgi:glutaconate CoA-transferase subunit B